MKIKIGNTGFRKVLVLSTAVLALQTGCGNKQSNSGNLNDTESPEKNDQNTFEISKTQFDSSNMTLTKFEIKDFYDIVSATGNFDVPPNNRVSISSFYGGIVKDINLHPGNKVKKGQKLFTLSNPELIEIQKDFLESKGQLVYLKSDFERQKDLFEDRSTSEKIYLKAESDYQVILARYESLRKKLELMDLNPNTLNAENIKSNISIYSPVSGYISSIDISSGIFLDPMSVAMVIINRDHLHLELNIFEKDIHTIKKGQLVRFRIQEEQNIEYQGEVYLVNPTVDPQKRMATIHVHIEDETNEKFIPGMYVEADIYTSSKKAIALAEEALVQVGKQYFVLKRLKNEGSSYDFVKLEISPGRKTKGYIEILNLSEIGKDTEFLKAGAFDLIVE